MNDDVKRNGAGEQYQGTSQACGAKQNSCGTPKKNQPSNQVTKSLGSPQTQTTTGHQESRCMKPQAANDPLRCWSPGRVLSSKLKTNPGSLLPSKLKTNLNPLLSVPISIHPFPRVRKRSHGSDIAYGLDAEAGEESRREVG